MTEVNSCLVIKGLSPREAQGVARYHNKLFHGGYPTAHIDADHETHRLHKYCVRCPVCSVDPPVSEEIIRLFAMAGYGMREVVKRFWEFSCAPDSSSVRAWDTEDGAIFSDQSSSVDVPPSGFRYAFRDVKKHCLKEVDLLPVQCYRLMVVNKVGEPQTGEFVVEAPSPGVAIEYHLATCGCLGYERIFLEETDHTPDDSVTEVAIVINRPFTKAECRQLDTHHYWEPWPIKEGF